MSNKEQPLSDLIGAPLVLYLPEEEVAALALRKQALDQWASHVWVEQPNVLDDALLAALRYCTMTGLRVWDMPYTLA